jgi:hypothetical protein
MQARKPCLRYQSKQALSAAYLLRLVPKGRPSIRANRLYQHLGRSAVHPTQKRPKVSSVRGFSRAGDRGRYSAFLYSEYFCATHRADALDGWSAILEHNPPRIAYFSLFPALHAISCRHCALLLFLLLLYCYYKSKALSIPFGLWQQRLQDSGQPDRSRRLLDFLLIRYT